MEDHRTYCRQTVKRTLQLTLLAVVPLLLLGMKPHVRGLILGVLASVADFLIISWSLSVIVPGDEKRSVRRLRFSLLGRYAVFLMAIAYAWGNSSIGFPAMCIGLFSVRIVLFLRHVVFFSGGGSDEGTGDDTITDVIPVEAVREDSQEHTL